MPRCIYLNTVSDPKVHTCDAGVCESVAECSAKVIIKGNSNGPDATKVRYTAKKKIAE